MIHHFLSPTSLSLFKAMNCDSLALQGTEHYLPGVGRGMLRTRDTDRQPTFKPWSSVAQDSHSPIRSHHRARLSPLRNRPQGSRRHGSPVQASNVAQQVEVEAQYSQVSPVHHARAEPICSPVRQVSTQRHISPMRRSPVRQAAASGQKSPIRGGAVRQAGANLKEEGRLLSPIHRSQGLTSPIRRHPAQSPVRQAAPKSGHISPFCRSPVRQAAAEGPTSPVGKYCRQSSQSHRSVKIRSSISPLAQVQASAWTAEVTGPDSKGRRPSWLRDLPSPVRSSGARPPRSKLHESSMDAPGECPLPAAAGEVADRGAGGPGCPTLAPLVPGNSGEWEDSDWEDVSDQDDSSPPCGPPRADRWRHDPSFQSSSSSCQWQTDAASCISSPSAGWAVIEDPADLPSDGTGKGRVRARLESLIGPSRSGASHSSPSPTRYRVMPLP